MAESSVIEQAIVGFIAEFMNISIKSRDEALVYLLTSIQQFELLVFIESEYGVELPPLAVSEAHSTVARLAADISAQLQPRDPR